MRVMLSFYLAGPFFMLIERSPADAWLSLCGLIFFFRCVIKKDWHWTGYFWVRAILAFWSFCLLSASLSSLPAYSLGEAFAWVRFPLFAFATTFWLARDPRILIGMLISLGAGMLVMSGILFAEYLIVGPVGGRLSWPYGDLNPGNYLAKAGLPVFCILIALAVSAKRYIAGPAALISVITIVASVLTGERVNFILRAAAGMVSGLAYKPVFTRYAALILIEAAVVMGLFTSSPQLGTRFIDTFIQQLPLHDESPYKRVWNGAFDAFETSPIIGIGPDNYRMLCPTLSADNPVVDCHTHPHNYYLQILGETGIIGLCLALVMVGAILWKCGQTSLRYRDNVVTATCFVIPFGFFFPIQSTADFFGQWNNIFMWSSIAIALAASNLTTSHQRDT